MKIDSPLAPRAGPAVLDIQGLELHMAGRPLICGLDFRVYPGQRWCVIGRNAVGKSSLLRALAGLGPKPHAGRVLLQGDALVLSDGPGAARLRAYLPQAASDRFDLSVGEFLRLHQRAAAGALDLPALARSLDIEALLQRPVTQLSGGERQRVGLGAVAAQDTALWLLDEPVSFQDPAHQRSLALWLCAQAGRAVVLTAHDMAWVQQCATHLVALLGDGAWRAGAIDEVLDARTLLDTFGCPWRQVEGRWYTA